MLLKSQSDIRRLVKLLQENGVDAEESIDDEKSPGRRQYDGSTGKIMAYGIGGGSAIGVLLSIFTFMNSAPWASKGDVAALVQDIKRIEDNFKTHENGPGHPATNAQLELLKAQLLTMNDKLSEMKADIKDIKDRRVSR